MVFLFIGFFIVELKHRHWNDKEIGITDPAESYNSFLERLLTSTSDGRHLR